MCITDRQMCVTDHQIFLTLDLFCIIKGIL
jgi:hypothetical protein